MEEKKEIRVIDFKDQYTKVKKGEFFVGLYEDHWLFCITRNRNNNVLTEYSSIYSSHEIDEDYEQRVYTRPLTNIDPDKFRTTVCSYDMFLAYNRKSIIHWTNLSIADGTERNIHSIRKEMEKSAGRPIRTEFEDQITYLLGVVSTDEDYYYIHIDKDFKLGFESCVGGFGIALDVFPDELKKFKNPTTETSRRVYETLLTHFAASPDVFVTPIYFKFKGGYEIENFQLLNMIMPDCAKNWKKTPKKS